MPADRDRWESPAGRRIRRMGLSLGIAIRSFPFPIHPHRPLSSHGSLLQSGNESRDGKHHFNGQTNGTKYSRNSKQMEYIFSIFHLAFKTKIVFSLCSKQIEIVQKKILS